MAATLHQLAGARRSDLDRRETQLLVEAPPTLVVRSVAPDALHWLLETVLAEAAARTPTRGSLVVSLQDGDERTVITCTSRGPQGTAPDQRSSSVPEPELELAGRIAAVHGGDLEWPERGDDAVRVTLGRADVLPSSRPSAADVPAGSDTDTTVDHDEGIIVGPDGAPLLLVVEDDAELRRYLQRSLSTDHRVVVAATTAAARPLARQLVPDLLVCDLLLPDGSGEELVHEIHADPDLSEIPVVIVTGRTDEELRVRLLRDGADDYVTKPFVVDELRARITNLIAHRLDVDDLRTKVAAAEKVAGQLQHALNSRVIIEQAKGFVSAERDITPDEAFEILRTQARSGNRKLHDLAAEVVLRARGSETR